MEKKARGEEKKNKETVVFAKGGRKEDSQSLDEYSQMVYVTPALILWAVITNNTNMSLLLVLISRF